MALHERGVKHEANTKCEYCGKMIVKEHLPIHYVSCDEYLKLIYEEGTDGN